MAAVVLGIVLRLAAALVIGQGGEIHEFGVIGENLTSGRGYSYYAVDPVDGEVGPDFRHEGRPLPSAFMPPLYTVLSAGAFGATSSNEAAIGLVQVVQALLAGVAIVLMAWLGRSLFGPVAGGLAALAYACYPALIYQATQLSASNLYLLLEIAALGLLVKASQDRGTSSAVAAGAVLGLVAVLRAEAVLLLLLAGLWLLWSRRRAGRPARAACVALVAVGLLLPVAWTVRNAVALERFNPALTTSGGLNLWLGNAEGATGGIGEPPLPAALERDLADVEPTSTYELDRDAVFREAAIADMRADPAAMLVRDLRKVGYMLTVDLNDHRARNPLAIVPWALLAVAGVLGIFRVPLRRDLRVLVLSYMAFTLVVAGGFFALGRFKLAIEYPMILFAAAYVAQRLGASTTPADVT